LIDGSCSDAKECSIKDLNGNCRKGCKHSRSEITSSCIIDGCVQYSSSVCSNVSGCVLVEGFCVSSFEDFGCIGVDSKLVCLSISICDFFLGGVCGERVLYDEDCGLVGEDVCFITSICKWDPRVGCVKVEEKEEKAKTESFWTWSFFAFIGLINFNFFFTRVIHILIIFFLFRNLLMSGVALLVLIILIVLVIIILRSRKKKEKIESNEEIKQTELGVVQLGGFEEETITIQEMRGLSQTEVMDNDRMDETKVEEGEKENLEKKKESF
jgi:hypothetical protein